MVRRGIALGGTEPGGIVAVPNPTQWRYRQVRTGVSVLVENLVRGCSDTDESNGITMDERLRAQEPSSTFLTPRARCS
ncbi:hypothetical protein Poly30_44180 [Planctomycetes bacterium Poly30]|uniref:Uncharacterized protein n=1 Tax=Saltatorellus ferox TaxID=2528018 RepID=A0A518EXR5_9BACT|nr:hypothetical protein Poly30_44180 [Planctomycetes bacterium Poly30]